MQAKDMALRLNVQHISCYCLSYEQGTQLMRQLERGEVQEQDEDTLNRMYDLLCDKLEQAGYEHYEVSNFAMPGFRSQHNSSYWTDESYIGLGAGAHSYDARQRTRSWNISSLDGYITSISKGIRPCGQETLTDEQHRMERIMLGLRTSEGIEKSLITASAALSHYLAQGLLRDTGTRYVVTREGIRLLNRIVEDLT